MSSSSPSTNPRRVGIVGYGSLGKYLAAAVAKHPGLELAFVWNRTLAAVQDDDTIDDALVLSDLSDFAQYNADIVVEVAHPSISKDYGALFLEHADYFCGSPTAFADQDTEDLLRKAAAVENGHGLYVPSGALWGAQDIQKMANRGTLTGLSICMKKHPGSIKVVGEAYQTVLDECEANNDGEHVVYEGSVRELCPIAPNNVNTMACAAIAAHNLGFDNVQAKLVADASLESHDIEISVQGPDGFQVDTVRHNPAKKGAVTGNATYASFLSSLLLARAQGDGVHLC